MGTDSKTYEFAEIQLAKNRSAIVWVDCCGWGNVFWHACWYVLCSYLSQATGPLDPALERTTSQARSALPARSRHQTTWNTGKQRHWKDCSYTGWMVATLELISPLQKLCLMFVCDWPDVRQLSHRPTSDSVRRLNHSQSLRYKIWLDYDIWFDDMI